MEKNGAFVTSHEILKFLIPVSRDLFKSPFMKFLLHVLRTRSSRNQLFALTKFVSL